MNLMLDEPTSVAGNPPARIGSAGRFILFGGVCAGKTTLLNVLEGKNINQVTKSQMISYSEWGIDSPGEYSEMGMYRRVLQTAAVDAQLILVLQDATRDCSVFPPNYFLMFPQRVLGIVTKMDSPEADPDRARRLLEEMGVTGNIFYVAAITGLGIKPLKKYLLNQKF